LALELTFDGYRALAFKAGKEVRLLSRNRTNFNENYPELIGSLKLLRAKDFSIDGEIAALDQNGKSAFQLLQSYGICKQIPLIYYAFDLLSLEGTDLRTQPLIERRKLLAKLLKKAANNIRFAEKLQAGEKNFSKRRGRSDSRAWSQKGRTLWTRLGRRSDAWVKVKLTQQQEFFIGGYTPPEGSRKYFGALLVGYYGPAGLLFAGRVGTGFSERVLAELYGGLQKIKRKTCPFVNLPEKSPGRWRQGITPAVMKRCVWVEPVLVAQVKFTERTQDGILRNPVFLGLRSDKQAKDVVRE
jgi:bifunctional non-homologous end joining protein LigD